MDEIMKEAKSTQGCQIPSVQKSLMSEACEKNDFDFFE